MDYFYIQIIIYLGRKKYYEKNLIASLAVIGGMAIAITTLGGIIDAIVKAKKKCPQKQEEEHKNKNKLRDEVIDTLLEHYINKCCETECNEGEQVDA